MTDYEQYFISKYPEEGVGYLKDGKFYPVENLAEEKTCNCVFDGSILIKKPDVILHSHTRVSGDTGDLRVPSYTDMHNQIVSAVEWGIVVTDGVKCEEPVYWGNPLRRPPLIEREFIPNIQDCLSLVQDWYFAELNIVLPNQPRDPDWDLQGLNYMDDLYESWGFTKEVAWDEMERGDLMMFKCLSAITNHLAVYVGNGEMIHHGLGQISVIEPVHKWQKRLVRVVRHREAMNASSTINAIS